MPCRLWLGLLFIVSTTAVKSTKSAVVSAVTGEASSEVFFRPNITNRYSCELTNHDKPVVEFNDSATLVQVTMQPALLLQIALSVARNIWQKMGACCSEFGESHEAAGNLRNHSRWRSGCQVPERNNFLAHVRHKTWFTSGFHCADIARKLMFPSKLLFYMPDHQEFPTFWTRFLRGCWCHGSTDESRRTSHRTRVLMKELLGWINLPVWHLEGAALRTGNLDVSWDHGGGGCGLVVVGLGWFIEMTYYRDHWMVFPKRPLF